MDDGRARVVPNGHKASLQHQNGDQEVETKRVKRLQRRLGPTKRGLLQGDTKRDN